MREPVADIATSGLRFAVATPADDAAIRRLLRENPLRGAISVTFEREPSYFAGFEDGGNEERTILAFEKERLVCMGSCRVSDAYVNGRQVRVGYLGELRLDASFQGRADILRRGYSFFRDVEAAAGTADFYFTSVTSDNVRARRLLERGVWGLPRYERLGSFETLIVPRPRRRTAEHVGRWRIAAVDRGRKADLTAFLDAYARRHQLAPVWTEARLQELFRQGLGLEHFRVALDGERIVGCAALWDRRRFRQTVIRGYAPWLRRLRSVLNGWAMVAGGARLPKKGETLASGFVSPLAVEAGCEEVVPALVRSLGPLARDAGVEVLVLGFSANDPLGTLVRRHFRGRIYRTQLYRVSWPERFDEIQKLDGRAILPEVACL